MVLPVKLTINVISLFVRNNIVVLSVQLLMHRVRLLFSRFSLKVPLHLPFETGYGRLNQRAIEVA